MGRAAKGTVLQIGDGAATEAFTSVSEVKDVSGGGDTLDTDDTTHHGSSVEEKKATIARMSDFSFDVNWDPRHATHGTAGLRLDLKNRTDRNFKLFSPASTGTAADEFAFSAYVTGIEPSLAVTGSVTATVTLARTNTGAYATATGLP